MAELRKRLIKARKNWRLWIFGTVVLLGTLLGYLQTLGVVTGHSGDIICGGNIVCEGEFFIDVPPSVTNYLGETVNITQLCFGKDLKIVLTNPEYVKDLGLYKADKRYRADNPARWKPFNFTGNCINVGNNSFMLNATKEAGVTVKWAIEGTEIDPKWIGLERKNMFGEAFKYPESFIVSFDSGLKITANDSKGSYSVKMKAFVENNLGVRQNYTLSSANMPFLKTKKNNFDAYEYNISIPTIPAQVKYVGFYFEEDRKLDIEINNNMDDWQYHKLEKLSFCGEDTCLDFWFDKMPLNYTANASEIKIDVTGLSKVDIDPTVSFADGDTPDAVSLTPLTNNTFAIGWCDETTDDIHLKYFYTNETNYTGTIDVNNSIGSCIRHQVSIKSFNSTHIAIAYTSGVAENFIFYKYFCVYDSNGNVVTSCFRVGVDDTASTGISVDVFNSTHAVVGYTIDSTIDDAYFSICNMTKEITRVQVDSAISDIVNGISVSTLNSTHFIIAWGDKTSLATNSFSATYNSAGTLTAGPLTFSTSYSDEISTFSINSTLFGICYDDDDAGDTSFLLVDNTQSVVLSIADADTSGDAFISCSLINSTHFAIGWTDDGEDIIEYAIYNFAGTKSYGINTFPTTTGLKGGDVAGYEQITGLGFCNQNWVLAWQNNSAGYFASLTLNTSWDGTCPAVADITAPTYSKNVTNATLNNTPCLFKLEWNDETALHTKGQYIFSTNNSGAWANASAVNFTATPENATNVTTLNSTNNTLVGWRFYAFDNAGNWNASEIFYLTTTAAAGVVSTCDDFDTTGLLDCADDCVNTTITVAGDLHIYSTGPGSANLTDIKILGDLYENYTDSCYVYWYGTKNITGG